MENKLRNELLLNVNGTPILLRPNFKNLQALEMNVAPITELAIKYMMATRRNRIGSKIIETIMMSATEIVQIIYYCQAAHDANEGKDPLSIDEVFDLVMTHGPIKLGNDILAFITRLTAGNKMAPDMSKKKSKT